MSLLHVLAEQATGIYRTQEVGVQPGDIVLDVGASFGAFTREALQRGASKVIAIDPAPEVTECLRRNLAAEIVAGKVIVVEKGAWNEDDTLVLTHDPEFTIGGHIMTGVHKKSRSTEVEVPLTTIDKMVAELGLERVDFIKMDIEGAEEHAIPGARATIARDRPKMAICVYHHANHVALLPNLIRTMVADYRSATVCSRPDALPEVTFFW
jgi:FkbM family methyltransferase